jgi:protein TonB
VTLHVLVGKDGRVKNVKVIKGVTGLNEAAIEAMKKWVFKPALSNNKPVAVWVEVPMDFKL